MRIRVAVGIVLLGLWPSLASATQGILLLADEGRPEWTTHVTQLASTVDKQKPAEVAFVSAATSNVQAAVDRFVQRGVSEIVAVPLFIAALGQRILVVPVLTPYGGVETGIKEQLKGLPHEVAESALMPDDRLVAWIGSRANAAAPAPKHPETVRQLSGRRDAKTVPRVSSGSAAPTPSRETRPSVHGSPPGSDNSCRPRTLR